MENKKEKWEIKYESYMNGGLEKEENELTEKYEKKEIDVKQYRKEQKRFEKIKSNLSKVANLAELNKELKDLKSEIEDELLRRYNDKQADKQREELDKKIEKSDKENEELLMKIEEAKNKLKDKTLSDADRKNIETQLNKDENKLKVNNDKFLELNEKRKNQKTISDKSELANMSDKDLKKNYQKISMKMSRNNFYAGRLLRGYDMEAIKVSDQKINWNDRKYDIDMKKLIAKGQNAEKLKSLKETAKEENEKNIAREIKAAEESMGKDVSNILKEEDAKKVTETAMAEVSEFDKKHPRLAKIKNFFSNIKNKIIKKEEHEEKKISKMPESQIPFPNDNEKEEKVEKNVEDKQKIDEEKVSQVQESKRESFMKRLKNMDEYEISDVAEKGLDGLKEDRYSKARKQLIENKLKSAEESKAKFETKFNEYHKPEPGKERKDNTRYVDDSTIDKLKGDER